MKIVFPAGYIVDDPLNDNLDVHIVLSNGKVFFAWLYTVANIQALMLKENAVYYWSIDMAIVKNLEKQTIRDAIFKIIDDGYLEQAFSEIGSIEKIYGSGISYNDLVDMTLY